MPAHRATLRRVGGRDLLDPTIGFVLQPRGEQTPTTAADATIKPALLGNPVSGLLDSSARAARHGPHIEGFDPNRVEPARDIRWTASRPNPFAGRPLWLSVSRSTSFVRARRFEPRCARARRCCRTLNRVASPRRQARHMQQLPGGQRRRHRHAAVDTDYRAITWAGDRLWDAQRTPDANARPGHGSPDRTSHPSGTGRVRRNRTQPTLGTHTRPKRRLQLLDVMRFDRHLPEPFVHTCFAPRRAPVRATEEVAHRLSEIPQRLLLHRLRTGRQPLVFGARGGQLRALLVVARRATARLPMLLLLDRQIPHVPGVAAMLSQHRPPAQQSEATGIATHRKPSPDHRQHR